MRQRKILLLNSVEESRKKGETAAEYAADLKRLYAKAYKNRNNRIKREDLARKVLDVQRGPL